MTTNALTLQHVPGGQTSTARGFAERGFAELPCPRCGATDGLGVRISDGDLDCRECEVDDIKPAELREIAARYLALAAWVEAMPADPGASAAE